MSARMEPIEQTYRDWTIKVTDDLPIPEGRAGAPELSVRLLRGGCLRRNFTYPAYRIWTLLAHWPDDLPAEPEPRHYTDTERNYLLTVWEDGTHEMAVRDVYRRWLSPVRLNPEPVETLAEVPC